MESKTSMKINDYKKKQYCLIKAYLALVVFFLFFKSLIHFILQLLDEYIFG